MTSISWRALETHVGLNDLPAFHRAFLTWRGVDGADDMPLRRVQQRVEAELNRLVQAGPRQWRLRDLPLPPTDVSCGAAAATPDQVPLAR